MASRKKPRKQARKQPRKDPAGGLTSEGRKYFRRTEGAHLKPGVKGPADTPIKQRRKGSFLRRHYAHLRGPLTDEEGKPTRLALAAHAWGEPVPKTRSAAAKLAKKGTALLEKYQRSKARKTATAKKTAATKKSSSKQKSSTKRGATKRKASRAQKKRTSSR